MLRHAENKTESSWGTYGDNEASKRVSVREDESSSASVPQSDIEEGRLEEVVPAIRDPQHTYGPGEHRDSRRSSYVEVDVSIVKSTGSPAAKFTAWLVITILVVSLAVGAWFAITASRKTESVSSAPELNPRYTARKVELTADDKKTVMVFGHPMMKHLVKNGRAGKGSEGRDVFIYPSRHKVDPWLKLLHGPRRYLKQGSDMSLYDFGEPDTRAVPQKILRSLDSNKYPGEVNRRLRTLFDAWKPLNKREIAFRMGWLFKAVPDCGEDKFIDRGMGRMYSILLQHDGFRAFLTWKNLRRRYLEGSYKNCTVVETVHKDGKTGKTKVETNIIQDNDPNFMRHANQDNGHTVWNEDANGKQKNSAYWKWLTDASQQNFGEYQLLDFSEPDLLELLTEQPEGYWPHDRKFWDEESDGWMSIHDSKHPSYYLYKKKD